MKSTARILSITERFGEDQKRQLTRELKELRRDVKAEMLYHLRQGLHRAEREYYKEIKPAPSMQNTKLKKSRTMKQIKPTEHATQNCTTLAITVNRGL